MILTINKNPSQRDIRQFAFVFFVGFALIAGIVAWRGRIPLAWGMFLSAGVIAALSIAIPLLGKWFFRVWMTIAFVLGSFWSRIILALIFYALITPIALFFRLIRRDALHLKLKKNATSYWVEHPQHFPKTYYDRLF